MKYPKHVNIVEVGARDGLQNEKQDVPASIKIELINRLSDAGFRNVESGSFVSPKWVPQMATSADVMAGIIRKPGVALGAEVLAAAVQILLGSPAGLLLLLTGLVQGAGAEAVFAATRYRRWDLPVLMLAGVGAAVASFAYTWVRFDYGSLAPGLLVVMFALRCLSGAVLAGALGQLIVKALYRSGVLSGLRIERDLRAAHG